jgi:hypothetical protein
MTTKLRAQFDGKTLVPLEPVDLPTGQVFEVEVREEAPPNEMRPGSPQAILRAIAQPPHLSKEDVDELERVIRESELPARHEAIFDEPAGNP